MRIPIVRTPQNPDEPDAGDVAAVVETVEAVMKHRSRSAGSRLVVGLLVLPLRVLRSAVKLSFKAGVQVGAAPFRVTAVATRRLGVVGTASLLVGVAVGVLFAPVSGRQMRQRLRQLISGPALIPDSRLQQAVVDEIGAAARTSDLPQPQVTVTGGVVTLQGTAPSETARIELEATAAAVAGVQGVVNTLTVAGS